MYNTVLHKAKVWKRERRATMTAATGWGIGARPNSSLEDCRTGFCCSFLKFQWCAAYKLAVDVTEWQRRCCSEGVCKSGSTLSHGERVQGSFNAAPVRAQLRSRILLDPACAAVGPVWISGRDRSQDTQYTPTCSRCCLNCHNTQQWSSSASTRPQSPCNLMIWNIAVVICCVQECSLHKNVWVAQRHAEFEFCARAQL